MKRVFIVDDEAPARERLKTLLADIAAECPHQLVGEAGNATEALERIAAVTPEVVLLDVQMPQTGGLELAKQLAQLPQPPAIVFVTAFEQYAINAFDLQATDYLLKPVRAERLAQALLRAAGQRARNADKPAGRQHFSVMERGRLLLVPVAEVIYLKAEMKYLTLHTDGRDYLLEESLASIEEELPHLFVRVHRNALVAKNAIAGVERGLQVTSQDGHNERLQEAWEVILKGCSERLPVSRRQWPLVKALVR
ncbi:MAG: LytTR family DNA-binding domain-containing protein [Burkholderiaceae bacterium]|nr:LytTR family DNA-binding domain-containing protein [Burkholderiaceae bacterium]